MHGKGVLECANGDRYEGTWENNGLTGEGSVVHANGETFQGTWREHRKHGMGTYHYINGEWYRGSFKGDMIEVRPCGTRAWQHRSD